MKFSFLLATIFPPLCWRFIESFRKGGIQDYEIVVCSPFEVSGDRIVWTRDEKQIGSEPATRQAFQHSSGDIVGVGPDDMTIIPGSLSLFLKEFVQHPDDLWDLRGTWSGTVFGQPFCGYPCARSSTINRLWKYFYPYIQGGGDPCLSLGAIRHGIGVRRPQVQVTQINEADRMGCPHSPAKEDPHNFELSKKWLAAEFPEYSKGWTLEGIAMYR